MCINEHVSMIVRVFMEHFGSEFTCDTLSTILIESHHTNTQSDADIRREEITYRYIATDKSVVLISGLRERPNKKVFRVCTGGRYSIRLGTAKTRPVNVKLEVGTTTTKNLSIVSSLDKWF